ncbi:hypothetical protein ES332_D05G279800v1 [Gossypium tomentosum]|uniref:Uncharacterized protein n=1 Tax=Gossypium tomentosum TaxID=34277 RepID=A0A5D2L0B9_GOSTO|nr:hypothetical protein ES332_D05G279800v1 [Gossypium tomentosum]
MPFGLLYCPNTGLLRCGQIRHFLCFSVNFLIPSIFRALFCRPKQTCVLQMQRVKMNPKYLQINPQENLSNSIKEERRTQQPTKAANDGAHFAPHFVYLLDFVAE